MTNSNVISLNQWKIRSNLENIASRAGWDTSALDIPKSNDIAYFYIFEPFKDNLSICSAFEYGSFKTIMKTGTKKFGSPAKISNTIGQFLLDYIDIGSIYQDKESLKLLISGSIINFATTKTAAEVFKNTTYRHFGNLVYRLNDNHVIMRPMAMTCEVDGILPPSTVALTALVHMMTDKKSHPDYFVGIDFEALVRSIISQYPDLSEELSDLFD